MNNFGFNQAVGLSGGRIRIGYGSVILAKIFYSDPFTYMLDANGNSIVFNEGRGSDMLMYSGRYLDLVNQPLDIPIHHTLGADTKQAATLGTGWTANGSHSYTGATASSSLSNLSTGTSVPSVLIDFTITDYTSGSVGGYSALGTYTVESTVESLTGVSFVGTVLINSVKQITNPNSFMTYADITTNEIVTLGNSVDGGSSKELGSSFENNSLLPFYAHYSTTTASVINGEAIVVANDTYGNIRMALDSTKAYIVTAKCSNVGIGVALLGSVPIINGGAMNNGVEKIAIIPVGNTHVQIQSNIGANNTFNVEYFFVKEILPISQKYRFDNKKINNILVHKTALSTTDRAKIQANPNLLGALGVSPTGTIPELDAVLDASDKYYGCMETADKYVVDANTQYSSSNHIKYSEDIDNEVWTKNLVTVTQNAILSPFGGMVADKVVESASSGEHNVAYFSLTTGITTSVHQTFSICIKAGERRYLYIFDGYGTYYCYFDALTGIYRGLAGATLVVSALADGWFKLSFTYPLNLPYIYLSIFINRDDTQQSGTKDNYLGDNTSGFYVTAAQLEPGVAATPYVATTSTAVIGTPYKYAEIANYTTTARKKAHNKGIQTTPFTLDAIGIPTAYDVSKLSFYSNEYGNTQTNLSTVGNFWLEEVIGTTIYQHKFDGTNLTTYTNNVAGTPTAHTPENANYLVGKGVCPKVTANPLATYTQSVFNLYTDGLYTSYNQSSRYAALGA